MIKSLIAVLITVILLLSGCRSNDEDWLQEMGIGVFTDTENLMYDHYPAGDEDEFLSIVKGQGEAVLIYQSGKMASMGDSTKLESKNGMVFSSDERNEGPLAGIYLGTELAGITDINRDVIGYLDKDRPVLAVLLDGFSTVQLKAAMDRFELEFFDEYYIHDAISVFTPVTNAGFAAMITGMTPDENGVHNRSFRDMDVKSIFGYALDKDKKAILLEGDIKILNTELEPVLHVDKNKDGDTDDELFSAAMAAVEQSYDLIFLHFHGLDDRGHQYGPLSDETLQYIKTADTYLASLSKVWNGAVVATSDHGMHETADGGDHGTCRYEDMIVPYFYRGAIK